MKRIETAIAAVCFLSLFATSEARDSLDRAIDEFIEDDTFPQSVEISAVLDNKEEAKNAIRKRIRQSTHGYEFHRLGLLAKKLGDVAFETEIWRFSAKEGIKKTIDPLSMEAILDAYLPLTHSSDIALLEDLSDMMGSDIRKDLKDRIEYLRIAQTDGENNKGKDSFSMWSIAIVLGIFGSLCLVGWARKGKQPP